MMLFVCFFFFSSRRRHTRFDCDWSSDVCSSDLFLAKTRAQEERCPKVEANQLLEITDVTARILEATKNANGPEYQKALKAEQARSEERRVGKESRYRWARGTSKQEKNDKRRTNT